MSSRYSLLDEPWLPVRLADGSDTRLGLIDTFTRSREIVALADTAPPSLVAQYRLLLAIVHRALVSAGIRWKDVDRAHWYANGLPLEPIEAYLSHWRERFWLFDDEHPFMQVPVLATAEATRDKRKPWTQIALASANGNNPLLFDHACDLTPVAIDPATAVATLLGYLQFTPAGLVKSLRGTDYAGPLVNTAAAIPIGATLAQTLCLALHSAPASSTPPDLPAWERHPPSVAELSGAPVLATGPNDRYTRLSRAVLFVDDDDGRIRWLHFAAGLALGEDPNAPDPMASFRAGKESLIRVTFNEGRAVWRDLPALVPSRGAQGQAAAVIQQAIDLHKEVTFESVYQPLLVAGVASNQLKLLRWRIEQIVLPSALLTDPDRALHLREQVAIAEQLGADLARLATAMTAQTLPTPDNNDTRTRARGLVDAGPLTPAYFAAVERAVVELIRAIGNGSPEVAQTQWHQALRAAALSAWERTVAQNGSTARALRADACYRPRLHGLLKAVVPQALSESSMAGEQPT